MKTCLIAQLNVFVSAYFRHCFTMGVFDYPTGALSAENGLDKEDLPSLARRRDVAELGLCRGYSIRVVEPDATPAS
jgi:hypothetical protein